MGLAGHLVPSQGVIREIERRRQLHFEMAQHVKQLDQHFSQRLDSLDLKDLYMHLVIRRGIRYQEEWVAWCDEAIQAIEQAVKRQGDK